MKTKFGRILENNAGLQHILYRSYGLSPRTIAKATNIENQPLFSSKEKIYDAIVDLGIINEKEVSFLELFEEEKEEMVW